MVFFSTNLLLAVLWAISSSLALALILLEQILRKLYIRSSLFKPWHKLGINPSYRKPSSNLHYFMRSWALPQVRLRQLNEKMFWEFKWRSNNHIKRLQFPWSTVSFKIFGMQCICPPCILSSYYWATRSVFLYRSHRHHLTYFLFHQIAFDKDSEAIQIHLSGLSQLINLRGGFDGCHWSWHRWSYCRSIPHLQRFISDIFACSLDFAFVAIHRSVLQYPTFQYLH